MRRLSEIRRERSATSGKRALLAFTSATTIAFAGFVGQAAAQEAQPDQESSEDAAASEPTIFVTGSRIARDQFDAATPVNVVGEEQLTESGFSDINDALLRVPSVSIGLGSSNASELALPSSEAGASFINLRGLGRDRSLVLIDGRRRVSGSTSSSAVDLSIIPAGLVERIEIITGGASAVYGADAVSGVANVILKDDFDGVELSVYGGLSDEGSGGEQYGIDFGTGVDFADGRGSLTVGASYSRERPLGADQRSFSEFHWAPVNNPANTGPSDGIPDQLLVRDRRFTFAPYEGAFIVGGQRYVYDTNGLRLIDPGVDPFGGGAFPAGSTTGVGTGADGFNVADFVNLRIDKEVFAARSTIDYELSDGINFFGAVDFAQVNTQAPGQTTFTVGDTLQRTNPLLPADLAAFMDANGLTSLSFNRSHLEFGTRDAFSDRTSFNILGGFDGILSNGWNWDVGIQFGQFDVTTRFENFMDLARYREAIDVVPDGSGGVACASGAAGCVPFFALDFGQQLPQATLDYFLFDPVRTAKNTQTNAFANISGDLFEMPAGSVKFAAGVEYREDTIVTRDDPLGSTGALRLYRPFASQDASADVIEGYGEIVVPVLSGQSFAEQLDFEAAVRVADYSTIGSAVAWRLGATWAPSDDIRFRVSRARSVRAPNLTELFGAGTSAGAIINDPCSGVNRTPAREANCLALGIPAGFVDPDANIFKDVITGGNPNLSEETSDSLTIGAVLTPLAIDGFSASIDYYNIKIDGAVGEVPFTDILTGCVDAADIDNVFCPLITRGANNSITEVFSARINVGELRTQGIDAQARYAFDAFGGVIDLMATATYLIELEQQIIAGDPSTLDILRGEINSPKFRGTFDVGYSQGPVSVGFNTRITGSAGFNVQNDELLDLDEAGTKIYNDVVISYEINDDFNISLVGNNVFSVDPPVTRFTVFGQQGFYDNRGRFWTLRLNARF